MKHLQTTLTKDNTVKIKNTQKGFLLNKWTRNEWLENPHKIPHIANHIVTAFENPYKMLYKEGKINKFENEKVTLKNSEIKNGPFSLHTEVNENNIKIYDLTGTENLQSTRKQYIKGWTKQQWFSAPFIGRVIFASIISSYQQPQEYIKRITKGEANNYIKIIKQK